MGFRISAVVFVLLAAALTALALAGFLWPEPLLHVAWDSSHYLIRTRWVGGWACLAATFAFCGFRYCRHRASKQEPSPFDEQLFVTARVLVVLGFVAVLALLLSPRIIR
jgi:hypothetical protein